MMRELTEAERAAMNEAMRPFWISRDGLLPKEKRAFEAGFIAGLECQEAANAAPRPELVEGLVEALNDVLSDIEYPYSSVLGNRLSPETVNKIRAALARVEGGDDWEYTDEAKEFGR